MDMMKNELSVLKEKELILDSSEQNCVRLMNLHKAKGLEGNIVIMAEAKNHKFSGGKYTDLVAKRQVYVPLKTSDFSYMDYLTFYLMKGSRQRINILANSSGLNMLRPQEQSRLLYLCIL